MGVTGSPDTQGILTIMQASYMEQVNIICESIEMNKKMIRLGICIKDSVWLSDRSTLLNFSWDHG